MMLVLHNSVNGLHATELTVHVKMVKMVKFMYISSQLLNAIIR